MNDRTDATPAAPSRRNASGLRRDFALLEVLAGSAARASGGLGVLRIAELTGRDKAQVSRTLATMAEIGLVERDPDTLSYRLGHQLYALAARTSEARLVHEAAPALRACVAGTHETTHLCVLRGGSVLTLASELSEHAFRGLGWQGVSTSAWRTSSGRVLISGWSEAELRAWYRDHAADDPVVNSRPAISAGSVLPPVPAAGKALVHDIDSLLAEIARIRERGYSSVDEEFEAGVVGVSAPVIDQRGAIIAALNVSAPKARLGQHLDAAGRYVAGIARELSAQLAQRAGSEARPDAGRERQTTSR
ncbi:IclR family transcriptional regulator [Leucobacter luti]|uniref:IclR family transcriptional regulator n=1 Tax=Leucobacter luti TaxID=340320 RepID=UPI001C68DC4D|nr:IclR family transcriptional regulator [Leucobacter luti]QYM76612.1 IclR family transcriptional regulator [Leucobacter luti]